MTPHPYTEDQLVEQPAIGLFAELGWHTAPVMEEEFGPQGTLQRDGKADVVILSRLTATLNALNTALPSDAIEHAINELMRDRSSMSIEAANREVYQLLKDGVKVSVPDRENGGQKPECVRVIDWDWDTPANNDFLLVSQMSIQGDLYNCRPYLIGFVNGLPLCDKHRLLDLVENFTLFSFSVARLVPHSIYPPVAPTHWRRSGPD
jgi:type I restriction enzyme R subunit